MSAMVALGKRVNVRLVKGFLAVVIAKRVS